MAKITVDGVVYEVDPANNLLQECLSQGLDLPYFCWHPSLGSVGACRQCAVIQYRDAEDTQGTLVMSCMTPITDGGIYSLAAEQASDFRADVIESLMTSHPHDCPVCEEGGECHLQDMTQMSGHNYRRFDKQKVTHRNQNLGPFINHEMNRCITCYRCVRFYDDYAGGTDLSAQASHHHTYFGRFEEGTLESEFSGNLVEVCPTGVFTDKPFSAQYTRKWDLQTAPSICNGCSVGCNITPGERYGTLRRVVNRYHNDINGYFLCDRGRFGAHYVNSESRLRSARDATGMSVSTTAVEARINEFASEGVIGIGSPRASNEANFALRSFVGAENYFSGHSDAEHEALQVLTECLRDAAFHSPSVRQIEQADAILVLGEDVTNTAPRVALALRQSVRNAAKSLAETSRIPSWQDAAVRELAQDSMSPLSVFACGSTRLDDIATTKLNAGQITLIEAGNALAERLSGRSPIYSDQTLGTTMQCVEATYTALMSAKKPLIICGTGAGAALMRCAANIARSLSVSRSQVCDLVLLPKEDNSVGHALLTSNENTLSCALGKLTKGEIKRAIVIENDLFERAPTALVKDALAAAELVVIDQIETPTQRFAALTIPSATFNECATTKVNYEGRAQLSFQIGEGSDAAKPIERWLDVEGSAYSNSMIARCAAEVSDFERLSECLPDPLGRIAGLKVPRQSHRYSGRTAMHADRNVHEGKQPVDDNSVMSFSMEGMLTQKDSSVLATAWAPRWNSNQAISKFQAEINGELKQGHPGVHLLKRSLKGLAYDAENSINKSPGEYEIRLVSHIFGSDTLSSHSPAIQKRLCEAYLALNREDALELGLANGDLVSLGGAEGGIILPLIVRTQTPAGVALVYPGSSALGAHINPHDVPEYASLARVEFEPSAHSTGLGLSNLVVNDAYSGAR